MKPLLALLLAHLLDALLSNGFEGIIGFMEEIIVFTIIIGIRIILVCLDVMFIIYFLDIFITKNVVCLGFHVDHFLG